MATDLFGRPLGGTKLPEVKLSLQQRRQATLLYHWMSLDYLKGLKDMIDALIAGADVNLELAKRQGRDALLANARWGVRDTSANWSSYAFPALEDFRKATLQDIAKRATESYEFTGANQCSRLLGEYSSLWMTPQEEKAFKKQFELVEGHAQLIDFAAGVGGLRHQLDDFSMTGYWQQFATLFPRLPRLRVRTDVEGVSGKIPPRTGVYMPQDDPLGTLQFAWRGNVDGILGDCQTLNHIGRDAVAAVGRDALWVDGQKMAAYARQAYRNGTLKDRGWYQPGDEDDPENAPMMVALSARTSRPCKWYFVEKIEGEFDDEHSSPAAPATPAARLRCEAGQPCPRAGWWLTPAKPDSRRRFAQGEVMPSVGGDYGATIWQWDDRQD